MAAIYEIAGVQAIYDGDNWACADLDLQELLQAATDASNVPDYLPTGLKAEQVAQMFGSILVSSDEDPQYYPNGEPIVY